MASCFCSASASWSAAACPTGSASGGYNAPSSESTHAAEILDQNFGTTANLVIQLLPREGTADEAADTAKQLVAAPPADPNVAARAGGTLGVQQEIRAKVKKDLVVSESIAFPVSLAVLVIVFGGLIAAFLMRSFASSSGSTAKSTLASTHSWRQSECG